MKKTSPYIPIYYFFGFLFIAVLCTSASSKRMTRKEYIKTYHTIAQQKMKEYGIPASITLAQGILESDSGNSTLATKANNHFGIKCHDWKGPSIKIDDDKKNECFRKYKSAEASFEDHSDFLVGKSRYQDLFKLKVTDYKGWAHGLKKAGYATNKKYANLLIKIIEEEELYRYDKGFKGEPDEKVAKPGILRPVFFNNNVRYVEAKEGETLASLSREFGMRSWELPFYNDLPKGSPLMEGERVYVRPKRSKASKEYPFHKVGDGQTMHEISQMYGIRLKSLLRKNRMEKNWEPKLGQVLFLRNKKPKGLN